MANKRKNYSTAQHTALLSQVDRNCPLCEEPLFHTKNKKSYKNYQIAHIYPLNATPEEEELLKNEERLSEDLNNEDNVIPLCAQCHGKFDNPRTVDEYQSLVAHKKKIIAKSAEKELWKKYNIEIDIHSIIDAIYDAPSIEEEVEIDFSPKTIDEKLNSTISNPTRRKIKHNVSDYYISIREKFATLDQTGECISEIITLQIKTYYLKQKKSGHSQQVTFENIVDWINAKTKPDTKDAAEIIASFFVQNCEIFE